MTGFALLLTLMYSGGVDISRCSCTGHTALYTLWSDNCCPGEDCMMITVMQLTDDYTVAHNDMPAPFFMPAILSNDIIVSCVEPERDLPITSDSYYPPGLQGTRGMVMRV